jgi:hypothetical protein
MLGASPYFCDLRVPNLFGQFLRAKPEGRIDYTPR